MPERKDQRQDEKVNCQGAVRSCGRGAVHVCLPPPKWQADNEDRRARGIEVRKEPGCHRMLSVLRRKSAEWPWVGLLARKRAGMCPLAASPSPTGVEWSNEAARSL